MRQLLPTTDAEMQALSSTVVPLARHTAPVSRAVLLQATDGSLYLQP